MNNTAQPRKTVYLTLEAASALAAEGGLPVPTLRYWVQTGKLRGFRPGRRVLVRQDDILALIEGSPRHGAGSFGAEAA